MRSGSLSREMWSRQQKHIQLNAEKSLKQRKKKRAVCSFEIFLFLVSLSVVLTPEYNF